MKSCRTNIEARYVFQQDVCAYTSYLIYVVRSQMDVGDRRLETFF